MNKENFFNITQPLPSDIELEKKMLGMIMTDNDIMQEVRNIITFKDFYNDIHQRIFYGMCLLQEREAVIDPITLANILGKDIEKVRISYLSDLGCSELNSTGFKYIASKIKELSNRRGTIRNLLSVANDMMNTSTDMEDNINKVNDIANDTLKAVNKGVHALDMKQLIEKTEAQIIENLRNGGALKGRQSGITDLDLALGGFENELVVIGGRPSCGKTTLTVNLLRGLAVNYKCLFFSMEQKDTQLITKIISQDTKIDNRLIDRGQLDSHQAEKVLDAMNKLKDLHLKVDERAGIGIAEIENAIIREKQIKGLDVVCIDYLQYMDLGKADNANAAFTRIVKQLKTLTKKYNICIILLSQLSRACEQRPDHHPMMSDLRDSGSIEQEADKILLLYREAYYNPETELKDIIEINLAKNRNGAVNNKIMLGFDLSKQLIYSLTEQDQVRVLQGRATEDKDKHLQMEMEEVNIPEDFPF